MKKNSKLKKWLFIAIPIVVVTAIVISLIPGKRGKTMMDIQYTTEKAERRTIISSLSGSGALQPANSYTVTTLVEGEVLSADFEEGDIVEKDSILYVIDSSDTANNIERSQISLRQAQKSYNDSMEKKYIKAPINGKVFSLDVEVGDEVRQGQTVATIRDSDTMDLTVPFPADDAKNILAGDSATVTLDNSFETLYGTVKSVSGSDIVGMGNTITRNVKISVKNPGGLGLEQAATASVNGVNCSAPGKFEYKAESTVTAEVSGTVVSIQANEGSLVSKDQVLITLGGSDLENSLQNARDNLRNAELSMENTQNQLDNYTIKSPIEGTIVDKEYKTGDTIEGGKTLCTIYDLSYLEMDMSIDELDISKVSVGQSVQITADAVEGKVYTGTITKVSVVSEATNMGATSYPVTVRIDETEGLRPGMNVDAEIVLAEARDVITVPSGAVNRGNVVLVTENSPSAKNKTELKAPEGYVYVEVETGVSDDNYIEIKSGITEKDTIAYVAANTGSGLPFPIGGMGGGMSPGGMGSGMQSGGNRPSGVSGGRQYGGAGGFGR
ncbi:MAG: HlyD family efflux transporter periplasmic adaptor subunit [Clostridia bacterium]|nr:HlyD family efflux transporter periplasmic adaptor subunit [Clostridia bacterium]